MTQILLTVQSVPAVRPHPPAGLLHEAALHVRVPPAVVAAAVPALAASRARHQAVEHRRLTGRGQRVAGTRRL